MRAWHYGPGGEAAIFTDDSQVPAGWRDHPFVHEPREPDEGKGRSLPRTRKAKR